VCAIHSVPRTETRRCATRLCQYAHGTEVKVSAFGGAAVVQQDIAGMTASTQTCLSALSQTRRWKRGIIPLAMNDPQPRVTWQATSNDENS
jgi:hypothetical protein